MDSRFSQALLRMFLTLGVISSVVLAAAGQSDPDPNSPTPVLLSGVGSTRALARTDRRDRKRDLSGLLHSLERGRRSFCSRKCELMRTGSNAFGYSPHATGRSIAS